MKRETKISRILWHPLLMAGVLALLFTACGGGGGGSEPGLSYTGNMDEATITAANGQELANSVFNGGAAGGSMSSVASVTSGAASSASTSRFMVIAETARKMALQAAQASAGGEVSAMGVYGQPGEIFYGSCGGTAKILSYSEGYDGPAITMNKSVKYTGYCDTVESEGATWTGTASMDAAITFNATTVDMEASVVFNMMTIVDDLGSFTSDGNVNMLMSIDMYTGLPLSASVSMDLRLRDNSDSTVLWANNYTVSFTFGAGYASVEISGRLYHPVHGYVDVSTPVILTVNDGDEYPTSGTVRIDGMPDGYATLTALGAQFNLVVYDVDGTTVLLNVTGDWANL